MLEGFKINCFPLNRSIRISIALPRDYNNTSRFYPVIYFLDGQNLYKDEDSYRGHALELEACIEALSKEGKDAIFIGIAAASNPERREQEYGNTQLADFIISSIHPYLASRYRMNSYIYSFACSKACLTAITLNQNELFKGMILISPLLPLETISSLSIENNNLIYIYTGNQEMNKKCLETATALANQFSNAKLVIDDNDEHNEQAWKDKIFDALNYLVL
ncbi:MAG: hypothetical protein K2N64_03050 [Anaeroplasmataceae bacterium]|nr:hypothetical protein [Anaeroplasmataceae bacterium]